MTITCKIQGQFTLFNTSLQYQDKNHKKNFEAFKVK